MKEKIKTEPDGGYLFRENLKTLYSNFWRLKHEIISRNHLLPAKKSAVDYDSAFYFKLPD